MTEALTPAAAIQIALEALRPFAALAEMADGETKAAWMTVAVELLHDARAAIPALEAAMQPGEGDADELIQAVVEEAEQACRYVAKHNYDNQSGDYREGFSIACEVCEQAIATHVARHKDRLPVYTPSALGEGEVERVARAIAPSRWAVMDGYLADMLRKYKNEHAGYDPDQFKDKESMALARAAIAAMKGDG